MIRLPFDDPGTPDTRSPLRLLVWVGLRQSRPLVAGVLFGVVWMVAQAMMPFAIGRAIENGIVERDNRTLALWMLILLALGATQAFTGVMRHRYAVFNWLLASFRLAQIIGHHVARSGPRCATASRRARWWRRSPTTLSARGARSTSRRGLKVSFEKLRVWKPAAR